MMKCILSIAGFDPTGGAGVLRDTKTFIKFGFYPCAVVSVNTVQNSNGVVNLRFESKDMILNGLKLVLDEMPIAGVKIGIPHREREVNQSISDLLRGLRVPIVFDPVVAPTLGRRFIENISVMKPIIDISTVVTPNFKEFKQLENLFLDYNGFLIVKGRLHNDYVEDVLLRNGSKISEVLHKKSNYEVRGTGCAFSSILTSLLALGFTMENAFKKASNLLEDYRRKSVPIDSQRISLW